MSRIIPPDTSLWLCNHLRTELAIYGGLQVGVRIPPGYNGTYSLIVIRDDGARQENRVTFDQTFGVTFYGDNNRSAKVCHDMAALVYSILTDDELPALDGSPIAGIVEEGCNGVYPVDVKQQTIAYYMTVEYMTVPDLLAK